MVREIQQASDRVRSGLHRLLDALAVDVLMIEADRKLAALIEHRLCEINTDCHVSVVPSAEEAFGCLARGFHPDLILLDYHDEAREVVSRLNDCLPILVLASNPLAAQQFLGGEFNGTCPIVVDKTRMLLGSEGFKKVLLNVMHQDPRRPTARYDDKTIAQVQEYKSFLDGAQDRLKRLAQ